jgi:hypothetical protein
MAFYSDPNNNQQPQQQWFQSTTSIPQQQEQQQQQQNYPMVGGQLLSQHGASSFIMDPNSSNNNPSSFFAPSAPTWPSSQQIQQPLNNIPPLSNTWGPQSASASFQQPLTSVGFDSSAVPSGALSAASSNVLSGSLSSGNPYEGEPPLLVELGINFTQLSQKTISALAPTKTLDASLMADGDLAGPFVFCFALGFFLLLAGKLHFGYVFGFGVVGCITLYILLNLLTQEGKSIEIHVVFSVLGYALLPMVILSGIAVVVSLRGTFGSILTLIAISWCTLTATRFFESALDARSQRYLIGYPVLLFFACFALLTVF